METCRVLLAMLDEQNRGAINFPEFKQIYQALEVRHHELLRAMHKCVYPFTCSVSKCVDMFMQVRSHTHTYTPHAHKCLPSCVLICVCQTADHNHSDGCVQGWKSAFRSHDTDMSGTVEHVEAFERPTGGGRSRTVPDRTVRREARVAHQLCDQKKPQSLSLSLTNRGSGVPPGSAGAIAV